MDVKHECAYPGCNCIVTQDMPNTSEPYCSDYCMANGAAETTSCACGHEQCNVRR